LVDSNLSEIQSTSNDGAGLDGSLPAPPGRITYSTPGRAKYFLRVPRSSHQCSYRIRVEPADALTAEVPPPSIPPSTVDPDADGVPSAMDLCPALPGPAPIGCPLSPAKLEVTRAAVFRATRRLDVLAPISALASGTVGMSFQAAGRTSRFNAAIDHSNRRVVLHGSIFPDQARIGTGILTLAYPGDADTQPQEVRLRAASQKAGLNAGRPTISNGELKASGQITRLARGVVRLQLLYEPLGAGTQTIEYTAPISSGRYRFNVLLPTEVQAGIAQRGGVVHSYTLFTGYLPRRVRGEMRSFEVLGPR